MVSSCLIPSFVRYEVKSDEIYSPPEQNTLTVSPHVFSSSTAVLHFCASVHMTCMVINKGDEVFASTK